MSQTQFERHQFRVFRATNKIHVGKYAMDIGDGEQFAYDGYTVRYGGAEYDVPQLRGLVGDWFVPATDTTTQYRSKPANVQVRPATPEGAERGAAFSMGHAAEDEAVVGTMTEATQVRTAAASGDHDRLDQLRSQRREQAARRAGLYEDSNPHSPPPQNASDVDPEVEDAFMQATEEHFVKARPLHQDGASPHLMASETEMRALQEANRRNMETIARRAAELEQRDPRKTKEQMGGLRHDSPDEGRQKVGKGGKYTVIRDEQDDGVPVGKYRFSDGASVGNAEDARNAARPTDVTRVASQQPVQVGNAVAMASTRHAGAQYVEDPSATHAPQAARAPSTTQVQRGRGNVGIDEIGASGSTGDVDVAASSDDLATLLPDAVVAGQVKRAPAPPPPSEDEEIAMIVEGWSVKRNWQKRVEEAVEFYGEWPEALEGIYSIESPAVVKQIKTRLADKG